MSRPRPPRPYAPRGPVLHGSPPRDPRSDTLRIAGLPAVEALFRHDAGRVEKLFFEPGLKAALAEPCAAMVQARRPFREVGADELARIAGTQLHGGVVALARPRPVERFDLEQAKAWTRPFLILDGIGNPHNLGAIARTCAFFGLEHLVLSDHPAQAGPSEAAWRVAEGGLEWLRLWRAERLPIMLKRLRATHHVVATALDGARPLRPGDFSGPKPVALVLGNEENGLPAATLQACDDVVMIPGAGRVQSLNVAATAAILVHRLAGLPG